ncbi:MAG: TetR/AcrR family transcriptional regulator [Kineosporiaceae bacterium]
MTPRRRDAFATREAILAVAVAAFAERGYRAVTVRDVAGAAGVDPALVVRYFGSKAALFAEGVGAVGAAGIADVLAGSAAGLPDRLADHLAGKEGTESLAMLVLSAADPDGRAMLAQLAADHLEGPVAVALTAAGTPEAEALARARAVTAVVVGNALTAVVLGGAPDRDRLAALLTAAVQW